MSVSYIQYDDVLYGGHFNGSSYAYRIDNELETLWDIDWLSTEWHDGYELSAGYSVITRLKSKKNDRVSLSVDSNGYLCARFIKGTGSDGRFIRTSVIPEVTDKVGTYVKWDSMNKTLYMFLFIESNIDIKSNFVYQSTQNKIISYDSITNYKGHIYSTSMIYSSFTANEIMNMGNSGIVPVGEFNYMPSVFSEYGYPIKDKNNEINLIGNADVFEQNKWWYNDSPPDGSVVVFNGTEYTNVNSLPADGNSPLVLFNGEIWVWSSEYSVYYKPPILTVSSPGEVSSPYVGQIILADKFPRVASLPVTVVNSMSYVLIGTPDVEYKGVGGSWVAQGNPLASMWKYRYSYVNRYYILTPTSNTEEILFRALSAMNSTDWTIDILLYVSIKTASNRNVLRLVKSGTTESRMVLSVSNLGVYHLYLVNSGGGTASGSGIYSFNLNISSGMRPIRIQKAGTALRIYENGVLIGSSSTSNWTETALLDLEIPAYADFNRTSIGFIDISGASKSLAEDSKGLTPSMVSGLSVSTHKNRLMAIGDSITWGDGSGWFVYSGTKNLSLVNKGIPSGTTDNFYSALVTFLDKNLTDVVLYSPYTPNGMTPTFNLTEEVAQHQKDNFLLAYNYCTARNVSIIVMELTPINAYDADQDLRRKSIIDYAHSLTGLKISLIDQVSTMESPNRWRTDVTVTDDGLHPNTVGYGLMRTKFNTEIDLIVDSLSSRNHFPEWVPLT